jgi:hypothetical protein
VFHERPFDLDRPVLANARVKWTMQAIRNAHTSSVSRTHALGPMRSRIMDFVPRTDPRMRKPAW